MSASEQGLGGYSRNHSVFSWLPFTSGPLRCPLLLQQWPRCICNCLCHLVYRSKSHLEKSSSGLHPHFGSFCSCLPPRLEWLFLEAILLLDSGTSEISSAMAERRTEGVNVTVTHCFSQRALGLRDRGSNGGVLGVNVGDSSGYQRNNNWKRKSIVSKAPWMAPPWI